MVYAIRLCISVFTRDVSSLISRLFLEGTFLVALFGAGFISAEPVWLFVCPSSGCEPCKSCWMWRGIIWQGHLCDLKLNFLNQTSNRYGLMSLMLSMGSQDFVVCRCVFYIGYCQITLTLVWFSQYGSSPLSVMQLFHETVSWDILVCHCRQCNNEIELLFHMLRCFTARYIPQFQFFTEFLDDTVSQVY